MDFESINLLILDVDGVLTDGRIVRSPEGETAKSFHVQDGCAIKLWRQGGGRVAILSGRTSDAVNRRAAELGIEWVRTGMAQKLPAYESILADARCGDAAVAYVGDDLPDLEPMARASFPAAVQNAVPAVKRASMYVTRRRGGDGAIAEIVEFLFRKQHRWNRAALSRVE